MTKCKRCNKELKSQESKDLHYGPVCYKKEQKSKHKKLNNWFK